MSASVFLAAVVALATYPLVADEGQVIPHQGHGYPSVTPNAPEIAPASDEGERAIRRFRLPEGMKAELFAAEPLLANPVAFWIDEQGRAYVCETFRHSAGVTDTRGHRYWLDDDLAARTVADRVAMYKKYHGDRFESYAKEEDRVRRIVDTDGDGRADEATVFAGGFNHPADGIGAGVLEHDGNVYFACIPHLWLLKDTDGDGEAEVREPLHSGYGVHVNFIGHDLHGLRIGPDGKLYFSIGDRGLNVEADGRRLVYLDSGSVLRCNLDGSELEVVATGLRNPQELAFDEYGNLFTGDNNSDGGDKARWVYLVEGGDSGWRIGFQYLDDRGPWHGEKLWHPERSDQPAYLLPPVDNLGDGPSGLTYYPGTGLPERYQGHFFMVDFRGSSSVSGIRSFAVEPKGAGFKLVDSHEFIWSITATDCEFGPDSQLYVSDWVEGWNKPMKGRLYRFFDPAIADSEAVKEVQQLLASELKDVSQDKLLELLAHHDMRVRQMAQFRLAEQGQAALPALAGVAREHHNLFARLHAIWGLGQIGRQADRAYEAVVELLDDPEAEVRAQAAKVAGEGRAASAYEGLIKRLGDASARVQFFAALGLGKLGRAEAVPHLLMLLKNNNDKDRYLRHAAVMGLAGCGEPEDLLVAADDPSPAVRMGVLLALRRLERPEIARFFHDPEQRLVDEAARAVYDVPIAGALPELASLTTRSELPEWTMRRALAANQRLREREHALAVAEVARREDVSPALRAEAVEILADWSSPSGRDRLLGLWRPIDERSPQLAAEVLREGLRELFKAPDQVRAATIEAVEKLKLAEAGELLRTLALDRSQAAELRAAALGALSELRHPDRNAVVKATVDDEAEEVRTTARRLLVDVDPEQAVSVLKGTLENGSIAERQAALETLGKMNSPAADQVLAAWLDRLLAADVPPAIQLDLLQAAAARKSAAIEEKLAQVEASRNPTIPADKYRECLEGGNARRGARIFFTRSDVSCQRCHKIGDRGGEVGPDLTTIGAKRDRQYLLESLVDPNRAVAEGFETVVIATTEGQIVAGVLKSENDDEVELITPEGVTVRVAKDEIDERTTGKSAMPEQTIEFLSKDDVRDLVEFLARQTGAGRD